MQPTASRTSRRPRARTEPARSWARERGELGAGPLKSYPRAIERFAEWVAASQERASQSVEQLRDAYLEDLKTGAWDAPRRVPILARSALGRLVKFLRETESAFERPRLLAGTCGAKCARGPTFVPVQR